MVDANDRGLVREGEAGRESCTSPRVRSLEKNGEASVTTAASSRSTVTAFAFGTAERTRCHRGAGRCGTPKMVRWVGTAGSMPSSGVARPVPLLSCASIRVSTGLPMKVVITDPTVSADESASAKQSRVVTDPQLITCTSVKLSKPSGPLATVLSKYAASKRIYRSLT